MPLSQSERLLLGLALVCLLLSTWQLALFSHDNSFMDGVCAAVAPSTMAADQRATRLFRWVSDYDDGPPTSTQAAAPSGLVTPRVMIEHRAYFRDNCGSKAWLLAILAQRAGLSARELRLCDAHHVARHVVCEVHVDGRWAVFDPTADLAFRRADGAPATAEELRDPLLLTANARRGTNYNLRLWRFDHPERLHFEKLPLVGGLARRVATRLTGRPAEQLAVPPILERPRLVAAACLTFLALLTLAGASVSFRRRRGGAQRHSGDRLFSRSGVRALGRSAPPSKATEHPNA